MVEPRKKYNVTWINNSESKFEIELTEEEKNVITKFLNIAEKWQKSSLIQMLI